MHWIDIPVLMEFDVQGYEDVVLNGATDIIGKTDYIIIEMSFTYLYKNQVLFDELYRKIVDFGFNFSGPVSELRDPETSAVLQIDGFFMRR